MTITFKCVKCNKDFGSKIVGNNELLFVREDKIKHKKCKGNIHPFAIIKNLKDLKVK